MKTPRRLPTFSAGRPTTAAASTTRAPRATVTDSTISRNFASSEAVGGGIWNGGILRLERSTLVGNGMEDVQFDVLQPRTYNGGGIYNADDDVFELGDAA